MLYFISDSYFGADLEWELDLNVQEKVRDRGIPFFSFLLPSFFPRVLDVVLIFRRLRKWTLKRIQSPSETRSKQRCERQRCVNQAINQLINPNESIQSQQCEANGRVGSIQVSECYYSFQVQLDRQD
jgi:hypothetical protein